MKKRMLTGELAAAAGVKPTTVRYYEHRGLLPPPERTAGGYRMYSPEALVTLRYILRAKALGFTLREIKALVDGRGKPGACADLCAIAERKARNLQASARRAARAERKLRALLAQRPKRSRSTRACPLARYLEGGDVAPGRRR